MTIQERIAACTELAITSDDPEVKEEYLWEGIGLKVAAGLLEEPTSIEAKHVEAYERGLTERPMRNHRDETPRLAWDEDAQLRVAHWLAQWGMPLAVLILVGLLVGALS